MSKGIISGFENGVDLKIVQRCLEGRLLNLHSRILIGEEGRPFLGAGNSIRAKDRSSLEARVVIEEWGHECSAHGGGARKASEDVLGRNGAEVDSRVVDVRECRG
jgi:hypothetical protein